VTLPGDHLADNSFTSTRWYGSPYSRVGGMTEKWWHLWGRGLDADLTAIRGSFHG